MRDLAGTRALDGVNLAGPTGQVLGLLGAGWPILIRAGCADGWIWLMVLVAGDLPGTSPRRWTTVRIRAGHNPADRAQEQNR